jgi:uncharacterized integral membrane protein
MEVQPEAQPEVQPQVRRHQPSRRGRGRLIVVAVIAVIALVLILQNGADTQLTFLWFDFTWPAWLVVVLTLVIGVVAGLLIGAYARRPKKR